MIKDKEIVNEKSQVFLDLQKELLHHNKIVCDVVKRDYERSNRIYSSLRYINPHPPTRPYDIDKQFNEIKSLVNISGIIPFLIMKTENHLNANRSIRRIKKLIKEIEKNYSLQIDTTL